MSALGPTHGSAPTSGLSRFDLFDERRKIAVRLRRREQRAPHAEPRDRIVGFGLREQPLRFGHLDDAGESILIASAGLTFAGRGGFTQEPALQQSVE